METGVNCVLCSSATTADLFFNRAFPRSCWRFLSISWAATWEFSEMIKLAMSQFQKPRFAEINGSALWNILRQRNTLILRGNDRVKSSLAQWKALFKKNLHLISFRVKDKLGCVKRFCIFKIVLILLPYGFSPRKYLGLLTH